MVKILIVDDDADKLRKLIGVLIGCGVDRSEIDTSRSASDARKKFRTTRYDIGILDLLLPYNDEDEPKIEASLELLRDVSEYDEYYKPERLIGFTAFSEAATLAKPVFVQALWTVVIYDETANDWEEQFRRVVAYMKVKSTKTIKQTYDMDLAVITALSSPELSAVHRLPWDWEPSEPMDDTTFFRRGKFKSGQNQYRVVSTSAPRMGSVAAALLTARVIAHFRPRFVVMAGICAGVKEKANLGDAVLFSPCWEWASGKLIPDGNNGASLEPAPHQIPIDEFIRSRAEELRKDRAFWLDVQTHYPDEFDILPKLLIAPGASGPSVIAHGESTESLKSQHRKLTAIDMEAYGVCAAAEAAPYPRPTAFVLKSVSDFADEEKNDSMRSYAAYTSARAIKEFFERYMYVIHDKAGT